MAGLIKQKQYDWKDSNMALFGSDVERNVKYESAKTEPAWNGSGKEVGLQIWRIVKFKVTHWPKEDYGKFFNGDSYIILNTYHPTSTSKELCYNVHFWIGSKSTQDEYGTAAYKTVELDTFHQDKPVQHREVEGYESDLFKSYFKQGIVIWEGGADTGFKHVEPKKYTPRLLHFQGDKKSVFMREVPRSKERLDSGDVFILDAGEMLYQWNGSGSNKDERFKALQVAIAIRSERGGKCQTETLEEGSTPTTHPFYQALDQPNVKDLVFEPEPDFKTTLFKVSDASGELAFTKVKDTKIGPNDLKSEDVFIIDTSKECFVWIGSKATTTERMNGIPYAHTHLMKTKHPLVPIVVLKEGQKNDNFMVALAA